MAYNEEELIALQGKVEALIDILSGRQVNHVDGEQIKRFIDNYAVIEALIENDSITDLIENVVRIKDRFQDVSNRVDGLLGAVEVESSKLVSSMGNGASGVALNVADMVLFQTSVSDSYKSLLQHLNDIDITGKVNRMESSLRESLGLIDSMRAQKSEINVLLQKVANNKALIDNMETVNENQTLLIDNAENLIAEMEKQIENYAFYAEEFDVVYSTAVTFVSKFSELVDELERVSARDAKLEEIMSSVISLTAQDFTEMEAMIARITTSVDSLALNTAQKLDGMLTFVNEYNAVGMALSAVKTRMQRIAALVGDELTLLSEAEIGYTQA
ncbi:MAG TPA: hypothetical protein EYG78_06460 [Sulfurovum sp.]|nr:hypothetical protein [Sulfurovum sp.]